MDIVRKEWLMSLGYSPADVKLIDTIEEIEEICRISEEYYFKLLKQEPQIYTSDRTSGC